METLMQIEGNDRQDRGPAQPSWQPRLVGPSPESLESSPPPAPIRSIVATSTAAPWALRVTGGSPLVDRIAKSRLSVVITGETGAGKEILARQLHERSSRAPHPFIAVNCAALCGSLLESELFGHERGSFTGAAASRVGLIEAAEGGTLFLDEVAELSASAQAMLLRVLESRTLTRVGGVVPRTVDVRFIAATHRDLDRAVSEGQFREDLRFRLEGILLQVPALRERPDEILPAAHKFLEDLARRDRLPPATLSADAETALLGHRWQGNFRELRNTIERAAVICQEGTITPDDLLLLTGGTNTRPRSVAAGGGGGGGDDRVDRLDRVDRTLLKTATGNAEAMRERIIATLASCGGNQTRAARVLGISRRTLISRLDALNIVRPRARGLRAVPASTAT
jgi:two-component system, NtrC family, response regulator AtoC